MFWVPIPSEKNRNVGGPIPSLGHTWILRVGQYTSPHLECFSEWVAIKSSTGWGHGFCFEHRSESSLWNSTIRSFRLVWDGREKCPKRVEGHKKYNVTPMEGVNEHVFLRCFLGLLKKKHAMFLKISGFFVKKKTCFPSPGQQKITTQITKGSCRANLLGFHTLLGCPAAT